MEIQFFINLFILTSRVLASAIKLNWPKKQNFINNISRIKHSK